MSTKEELYDEHISPLMTEIIRLAKEHNIAMVASFELDETEDDGRLLCTTAILPKGTDDRLVRAKEALYPRAQFAAFTIFTPVPK